jgi:hypothetical protein
LLINMVIYGHKFFPREQAFRLLVFELFVPRMSSFFGN